MEPNEPLEDRLAMADMHDDVIARIDDSIERHSYIDACWYAYSCFESRINRAMLKIVGGCPKEPRTDKKNPTGIRTKIECLVRLCRSGHPMLDGADVETLNSIKGWCKERNDLVHDLVTLDHYTNAEAKFASLANRSRSLVKRAYKLGAIVREAYYSSDSVTPIDSSIAKKCRCTSRRCMIEPQRMD